MAKKDKKKKKKKKSGGLIIKVRKKSSFKIPEGMYKAKLENVEVDDGQYGEQIVWTFRPLKKKYKKNSLKMWSDVEASPKNKTGKCMKALGHRKIKKDGEFDIEKLVGRKCTLIVEDHTTAKGDETSKITGVLPYDVDDDDD